MFDSNHEQLKSDMRFLAGTKPGRRLFKRIYKEVEKISMSGNSWTFYNEGSRNAYKLIWVDLVEAAPKLAAEIATEVYKEQFKEEEGESNGN